MSTNEEMAQTPETRTMGQFREPYDASKAVDVPWRHGQPPVEPKGPLLFVTAPSGMGKTTLCKEFLSRGYVYYEGDAFFAGAEPYPGQAPSADTRSGTRFVVDLPEDRLSAGHKLFQAVINFLHQKGTKPSKDDYAPYQTCMCADIAAEHKRLGGSMVVAFAVYEREARDLVRQLLASHGEEVVFVVMNGSPELNVARLEKRRAEDPSQGPVEHRCEGFEPATEDEPRTIGLELDGTETPAQLADVIEKKVKELLS